MVYNKISSSSKGNAIVYHDEILIDVGIPYVRLRPHIENVKYIFLTHEHGDHLMLITISQIIAERPDIVWVVPFYLLHKIEDLPLKHVFVVYPNKKYKMGRFTIETVPLFHDVPNIGYKVLTEDYKLIHATDTGKIDHVEAKHYDLYAIEWNHDIFQIAAKIEYKMENNIFSHEIRVLDTHLSAQRAHLWIESQRKESSEILKLHKSDSYIEGEEIWIQH